MKFKKILFTITYLLLTTFCQISIAQDFVVKKVYSEDYPIIKILTGTKEVAQSSDFKIISDDNELNFAFDTLPAGYLETQKQIFFLFEFNQQDNQDSLNFFFDTFFDNLKKMPENSLINIAYSFYTDTVIQYRILSSEFSSNYNFFQNDIKNFSKSSFQKTFYSKSKNNYQFLCDYLSSLKLSDSKTSIIIFTKNNYKTYDLQAFNSSVSIFKDAGISTYLIKKGKNADNSDSLQIEICKQTSGIYTKINTSEQLSETLMNYFNDIKFSLKEPKYYSYRLTFEISQDRINNYFYFFYKGNKIIIPVKKKIPLFEIPSSLKIIFVSVCVLNLLFFSLFIGARRSFLKLSEKLLKMQYISNPEISDKDNSRTQRGTEGIIPILIVDSGDFRKTFELTKKTITIGRAENSNIIIPDTTVSGNHAEIYFENGSFYIKDLESTNGIIIENKKIKLQQLNSGDKFKLGNVLFKLSY